VLSYSSIAATSPHVILPHSFAYCFRMGWAWGGGVMCPDLFVDSGAIEIVCLLT